MSTGITPDQQFFELSKLWSEVMLEALRSLGKDIWLPLNVIGQQGLLVTSNELLGKLYLVAMTASDLNGNGGNIQPCLEKAMDNYRKSWLDHGLRSILISEEDPIASLDDVISLTIDFTRDSFAKVREAETLSVDQPDEVSLRFSNTLEGIFNFLNTYVGESFFQILSEVSGIKSHYKTINIVRQVTGLSVLELERLNGGPL